MLPIGLCAHLACVWEVTARKAGNVHRLRDFTDTHYLDFLHSAAAVAPVLDAAPQRRLGETVLECVRATRAVTTRNTNLGIVLLLAPLAAVAGRGLRVGVGQVLDRLDVEDAKNVYAAIRLAQPGGLNRVDQQDVADEPTLGLREIMALAADRDSIARQYATGFRDVFDEGVPTLRRGLQQSRSGSLEEAIVYTHLHWMATVPDSLIARKRGPEEAAEAGRLAHEVLISGWPAREPGWQAMERLDAWLRAEGNARNPGTSADLVAASLFVALHEGVISLPLTASWSMPAPTPSAP